MEISLTGQSSRVKPRTLMPQLLEKFRSICGNKSAAWRRQMIASRCQSVCAGRKGGNAYRSVTSEIRWRIWGNVPSCVAQESTPLMTMPPRRWGAGGEVLMTQRPGSRQPSPRAPHHSRRAHRLRPHTGSPGRSRCAAGAPVGPALPPPPAPSAPAPWPRG